jgi:transcription-repair coupling factor (superfamily II helicase)
MVTGEARRRLRAIEEFSELGSGFNIAMQDLDIRGAGNLLGGEQSGFIADVGYETYQRILKEAVSELRESEFADIVTEGSNNDDTGQPVKRPDKSYITDCQIESDFEIMIPESYVSSISERIRLYRELNDIGNDDDLDRYAERLTDRFGKIPPQTIELLNLVQLRREASQLAIEKIIMKNGVMICSFISDPQSGFYSSPLFRSIISHVATVHSGAKIKHTDKKLTITFPGIGNVKSAINLIAAMAEQSGARQNRQEHHNVN